MEKHLNLALILALPFAGCSASQPESLVPDTPSSAPDYFCTWNIQGYIASYPNTSDAMREQMVEENLFGNGPYQNWLEFFPEIRSDLYFVMDDSWDIPRDMNARWGNPYYGTMELSQDRFPYILASTYPNDAVAVAAIGRALGREYVTKEVPVAIEGKDWSAPVGIFGNFESLTICYPDAPSGKKLKVYAQDLAGETPVDITGEVTIESNCLKVPGKTISRVGLMNATEGDRSGPGLVIKVM